MHVIFAERENSYVVPEYSEIVLPPLTFMMDPTMNVRGGSTILRISGVSKNYSEKKKKKKMMR